MDFIFMLTRADATVGDAPQILDSAIDSGVLHIGFKDVGVPLSELGPVVSRIRECGGISYLEVVSTTQEATIRSLHAGVALGVDRILGGTDIAAAQRILGDLSRYFPFPGRPVGHPTRLQGDAGCIESDVRDACARGCGGVDLLAYRATDADPLELVRAARRASAGRRLIVAGSVHTVEQIHALASAGVDAFTVGSAVFEGSFSPTKGSLRGQIDAVLAACATAPRMAA